MEELIEKEGLTGNKDVDREILYNIDDHRLIIQICQSPYGKEICNQTFYRNYLEKYIPAIYSMYFENKTERVNWKKLYFESVYYIGKLKEEFSFEYRSEYFLSPFLIYIWLINRPYYSKNRMSDKEYTNRLVFILGHESNLTNIIKKYNLSPVQNYDIIKKFVFETKKKNLVVNWKELLDQEGRNNIRIVNKFYNEI